MRNLVYQVYDFKELEASLQDKIIKDIQNNPDNYFAKILYDHADEFVDFNKSMASKGFDIDYSSLCGNVLGLCKNNYDTDLQYLKSFNLKDIDLVKLNEATHIFGDYRPEERRLHVFIDNQDSFILLHDHPNFDMPIVTIKDNGGQKVFMDEIKTEIDKVGTALAELRKSLYKKYIDYNQIKKHLRSDFTTLYFKDGSVLDDNKVDCQHLLHLDDKQEKALNKILNTKTKEAVL